MSQKRDRCLKYVDQVKVSLTHAIPQKTKSEFVIKLEQYRTEFRKQPESDFEGIAERFTKWIKGNLKGVPESVSDDVRASLFQLDLAVSGRRK